MIPSSEETVGNDTTPNNRPGLSLRARHTRSLRDIVEVVALLIAGFWALYVFVYENRIVPALAPPTPSISINMRHVGNDGNLAVIRLDETIRNAGTTEVNFLGYSVTVFGSRIVPFASPQPAKSGRLENELEAYNTYSTQVPIFRDAFVTEQGNGKTGRGLTILPAQTETLTKEFYVPFHRFDRLIAWVVAVYVKSSEYIPTTLVIKPSGVPDFKTAPSAYRLSAPLSELDLKAE
jgi:hypothetical protein